MSKDAPKLLYRSHGSVTIGQIERYIITYRPKKLSDGTLARPDQSSLFVRVKNCEIIAKRAAYLMGPYILYVELRPIEFDHKKPCYVTADQPSFEPNLQPNSTFDRELSCHIIRDQYVWVVDVISQALFSSKAAIDFEISIAKSLKGLSSSSTAESPMLSVLKLDTKDLWGLPPLMPSKPVHLVVLTHGLHSNVGADMLYLKEQIEKSAASTNTNIIVRGCHDNACKTERGIKYLGMKVAEYIINDVYTSNISKISFIGHSLGGLIQTFAIAYIAKNFPWFFKKVHPVNFVTLASPLLGISHIDSPGYVQAALSLGAVGRTGQELSLLPTELDGTTALLELLPTGITHLILKKFKRRTVYANAIGDGIVPLRTSALLFLDYKGLREVAKVLKNSQGTDSETSKDSESYGSSISRKFTKSYRIPDFMSSMPFAHSINPSTSLSIESAKAELDNKPDDTTEPSNDSDPELHLVTKELTPESVDLGNPEPNMSNEPKMSNAPKLSDDIVGEIPAIPENNSSSTGKSSIFMPLQNAFASWVAPQALEPPVKSPDANENPLPKASVIESAKYILLPHLPPKDFILEPTTRPDPVIHNKVYDDKDIHQFKQNRRDFGKDIKNGALSDELEVNKEENILDFALNPFADNFSNFFISKSNKERSEERIAMKWHDGMPWRKILVNVKGDAHNNIFVRRRFANAYGWLVIDALIDEHFGSSTEEDATENSKPESLDEDKISDGELSDDGNLLDNDDDDDFDDFLEESFANDSKRGTDQLEVPKQAYPGMTPKLDDPSYGNSYHELNNLLVKDSLLKENLSYNYTPFMSPPDTSISKKVHNSGKRENPDNGDWINSKNYNEDSLFTMGPTGFLSNVNDKISKMI